MAELHVYDCESVLASIPVDAETMLRKTGGGPANAKIDNGTQSPAEAAQKHGERAYIFTSPNADILIEIITRTVDPDSWEMNGGWGSIAEYDGKLVVRQTDAAHAQVKYLLQNLGPEFASRSQSISNPPVSVQN